MTSNLYQNIKLLPNHQLERDLIESTLNLSVSQRDGAKVEILEAGCGRRWDLLGLRFNYQLTGLDLDPEALRLRMEVARDLDIAIHGDILSTQFSPASFDIIYSSYVLEHMGNAEGALNRFVCWLRPNGLLVLKIPDGKSAYSTLAKLSPHWLHIFYYRWLIGSKNAGKPGHPPYKTVFDPIVSANGLLQYAKQNELCVLESTRTSFESTHNVRGLLVRLMLNCVHLVSGGRRSADHCTLTFILRKNAD